jgi:glycerol-3-phosphate dehydrogenase
VANYVKCVGLIKEEGFVRGIEAKDMESGEEFEVRGRCVVNATGVFVDELRRKDEKDSKDIVAISQGIHLVLPKEFLPGNSAIMVPKTADGRVLFGVPWHDHVVFGTTDTPLKTKDLEPRALPEERDFVMEHAAKYLVKDPTPADVRSIFAGLRPLVKAGEGGNTAALSRDHTILVAESGLLTVTGGKWTTYRKMGEDIVDHAEMVSGVENKDCVTKNLQIRGWTRTPIKEPNLALYGSDAAEIRELAKESPELGDPIVPGLPYQKAEVVWHARKEMARTVEDVLSRRTRALLLDAQGSRKAAAETARLLAGELGRDEAWAQQQTETYERLAEGYVF